METILSARTILHRVWKPNSSTTPARAANTFNPGYGDPTRFAPLNLPPGAPPGSRVPTLYVGETFAAAAFETVFRDVPPAPGIRRVWGADVDSHAYSKLLLQRNLTLAELSTPALGKWGLTRQQLIESGGRAVYLSTVKWAEAIHRCFPGIHGLTWTSRQLGMNMAYIFFGDRVMSDDIVPIPNAAYPFANGLGRTKIEKLADQYQIVISRP
ncbi:RES family NAD+ phosphorylase [Skermanella aerolata]|uniref:RES family NAD+ phosphorylase n=1 Tax=Skermanella aerolata TaxID=393310 RepID=UPI003D221B7E